MMLTAPSTIYAYMQGNGHIASITIRAKPGSIAIDNHLISGFKLIINYMDNRSLIIDPRGFSYILPARTEQYIIANCVIQNGLILTPCAWARPHDSGTANFQLVCGDDFINASSLYTRTTTKVSYNKLKPGDNILLDTGETFTYCGKVNAVSQRSTYDNHTRSITFDTLTLYLYRDNKGYHLKEKPYHVSAVVSSTVFIDDPVEIANSIKTNNAHIGEYAAFGSHCDIDWEPTTWDTVKELDKWNNNPRLCTDNVRNMNGIIYGYNSLHYYKIIKVEGNTLVADSSKPWGIPSCLDTITPLIPVPKWSHRS